MNLQMIEKNWSELKSQIKTKWDKFNDTEIDNLKQDLTQLSTTIQKTYGVAKEQADIQYNEFRKSIHSLVSSEAPAIESVSTLAKPAAKLN